jgi:hypothetical protein
VKRVKAEKKEGSRFESCLLVVVAAVLRMTSIRPRLVY